MHSAALQLFEESRERNDGSIDRALSETIQVIALLGLSRTDFFSHSAFYGGTALRLLYGLDRFSEDLDFSLIRPQAGFGLGQYFQALTDELESFEFSVDVSARHKRHDTTIESAFIKANTLIHVLEAGIPAEIARTIHRNAVCKVKLEIDVDPPPGAEHEVAFIDEPVPFSLQSYSGPALFAGKMDALLSRAWKTRVKGRDWYDYAFLVRRRVPLLLSHLEARLRQKGVYSGDATLTEERLRELVERRIETVDIEAARTEVLPFVRRPRDLDVWSKEYFRHVLRSMSVV